ncbi:MAG: ParA family protein [Candidatus Nanohaloarchaeota archaeon QJJ-7]|nr:ParA family protein [Candidatus Nanohaloarchaeota archaeon QJJ-7]
MPHRTSFVHTKGGTGKTTAAVNVAGFLSRKDQHVLLVDGDPEGHATRNLGLEPERLEDSLHELLLSGVGKKDNGWRDCVYPTAYGIDVVPGSRDLHDTYIELSGENALQPSLERVEGRYDHVIIDAPSSYRHVVTEALKAAHDYFLVLDSSIFSQQGGQTLKSFLKKLPNRHEVRVNPTKALYLEKVDKGPLKRLKEGLFGPGEGEAERIARGVFGDRLTKLPYCSEVVRSQSEGRPLSHFENVPKEARVYEQLAEDLIEYSWR